MVSQEYIDKLAFGRKYEIICQDKIKNESSTVQKLANSS